MYLKIIILHENTFFKFLLPGNSAIKERPSSGLMWVEYGGDDPLIQDTITYVAVLILLIDPSDRK